jgi:hypothetical protein
MRRFVLVILVIWASLADAQVLKNLFDHVYWQAWGQNKQRWSYEGMNNVGRLDDTIEHAIIVADRYGANLCLNRWPFDTAAVYTFPGIEAVRANFSGAKYPDFLVAQYGRDPYQRIFLGTDRIDSFVPYVGFHGGYRSVAGFVNNRTIVIADVDSNGRDDIIWSNPHYEDSVKNTVGALFLVRGGSNMDSIPDDQLIGTNDTRGHVGGNIFIGKFRDTMTTYLAEVRTNGWVPNSRVGNDSFFVYLYPLGPKFRLVPTDSMLFVIDTLLYDRMPGWDLIHAMDISGDGIDDILVESIDHKRYAATKSGGGLVLGYTCGNNPSQDPTYSFHGPRKINEINFGDRIIDVGDICGKGYHSILISAETTPVLSIDDGAVFLYNVGKGYRDTCVGWAHSTGQPSAFLGHTSIAVGDINGDSLADFMVGSNDGPIVGSTDFNGRLIVFLGDSSYATPTTGVEGETIMVPGAGIALFPNPCQDAVWADCSFPEVRTGRVVELVDMLGRTVQRLRAEGRTASTHMDMKGLPAGAYLVKVSDNYSLSKILIKTN